MDEINAQKKLREKKFRLLLWIGVGVAAMAIVVQWAWLTCREVKLHFCPEPHWHVCNDEEFKARVSVYLACYEGAILDAIDAKLAFLDGDTNVTLMDMLWTMGHVYLC